MMRSYLLIAAAGALTALIVIILVPASRDILPGHVPPERAFYLVLLLAFLLTANLDIIRRNIGQTIGYIAIWVALIGAGAFVLHLFGV
ncbi:hypothetical protein L5876_05670 [Hyphobacterium sp. SN044]|uniref:hypothetical protein n=1 Tax=Hyphobacterium sp. SN044 TaxID=2912575 RepID=UPI001F1FA739|nr:hypothetical protein [Hyphobacterium sp. SN044]MCF8879299.1 hypothetical protein [Hyphobacterium sp. SN044]